MRILAALLLMNCLIGTGYSEETTEGRPEKEIVAGDDTSGGELVDQGCGCGDKGKGK